jgi:hypothetical protein
MYSGIDPGNLGHPASSLRVLQSEDVGAGPVEVKGQVRYLLVQPVRGVAGYPPRPAVSTSKSWEQAGQLTWYRELPVRLIRW